MLELGAHQPPQRGGGPTHGDRRVARRRREALEHAQRVPSHCLELGDRGRVGAQVGVRQEARPDPERLRPRHGPVGIADRDLARAAPHVHDRHGPLQLRCHAAGRAHEREPSLLVPGQHGQRHPARPLNRGGAGGAQVNRRVHQPGAVLEQSLDGREIRIAARLALDHDRLRAIE